MQGKEHCIKDARLVAYCPKWRLQNSRGISLRDIASVLAGTRVLSKQERAMEMRLLCRLLNLCKERARLTFMNPAKSSKNYDFVFDAKDKTLGVLASQVA